MKNERLKEFFKKIHNPKNSIPEYATILIRPGKNIMDFKIKKENSNILKIIAHDEKSSGWFLHSYHIPIKNLGLSENSNNKTIVEVLNEPRKITRDKATKELMEEILRKYHDVLQNEKLIFLGLKDSRKKRVQNRDSNEGILSLNLNSCEIISTS